jgi:hypothetical protein
MITKTLFRAVLLPMALATLSQAAPPSTEVQPATQVIPVSKEDLDALPPWQTDIAGLTPFVVPPGHVEVDALFSYAWSDRSFGKVTESRDSWDIGSTVLKVGLFKRLDGEVMIDPYYYSTLTRDTGDVRDERIRQGFGGISAGLRYNLWQDDSGRISISALGDVRFPVGDCCCCCGWEGSPGLLASVVAGNGFEFRLNSTVALREDRDHNMQEDFRNLFSVSHQIVGPLSGYGAFSASTSTVEDSNWSGDFRVGLNYRFGNHLELETGSSFGVNGRTSDFRPYLGLAARF